jgi:uncharacterized membrane-anchored protein YitT (DUF2179 family)
MFGKNNKNKTTKVLYKYMTIIVGSVLMAAAVNFIYEPLGLVTGGLAGLAIVVKEITGFISEGGFPVWLFTVITNIPLFIISIKLLGIKTMLNVFIGTSSYILALMVIPIYDFQFNDMLLSSVIGGTITGIGLGMVFSYSASTGGTDLLATLIQRFKRHLSVPVVLIFIDGAVIAIGALVFGLGNALYAIISVFIAAKVSDGILEGLKFAKMAYIISDEYNEIAKAIMTSLDRGVTGISSTGMFSNRDRKMLFCVVSKKEIVKITEIAKQIDPNSFVIVNDVREVMGEGFIEYRQ